MIEIFVPTYRRQELPILKLLDDSNISITLCVRDEEYSSALDFCKIDKRIKILNLGKNITNLGETRKRICQHCIDNDIKYCIMFDDSLNDIQNLSIPMTYSECLLCAIKFLQNKQRENKYVFCYTMFRKGNKFLGVSSSDEYFVGFPLQAEIIDVSYLKKYHFNYEDMNKCGLEDIAFFADAVKKGLVFVSNQNIVIDGKLPNVIVDGGSHSEDSTAFEIKRDKDHARLCKYIGPMYGIMLTKKYRESVGCCLTYARIDFSYFRDVLVTNRDKNKKIIDSQFKIEEQI